jgi:hypothetical protein
MSSKSDSSETEVALAGYQFIWKGVPMRTRSLLIGSLFVLLGPLSVLAKDRILYVDSYHEGYGWSDGITEGIQSVLQGKNDYGYPY